MQKFVFTYLLGPWGRFNKAVYSILSAQDDHFKVPIGFMHSTSFFFKFILYANPFWSNFVPSTFAPYTKLTAFYAQVWAQLHYSFTLWAQLL
jgi:hypothetical protein